MEKIWNELSRTEQDLYLTLLWRDGYSEKAIADFFSTTKGRIVRRRSMIKLPNTDRPVVRQKVDPERFRDLLDLHVMQEMEKDGVAAIAPVTESAPITEPAVTCVWPLATLNGKPPASCGKPAVPGHRLCKTHLALALPKH